MKAFQYLSSSINVIVSELDKNQRFKKLVKVNGDKPLSVPDISETVIEKELKPYPFSQDNVQIESEVIVRAYISDGEVDSAEVITDYTVMFDILVPVSMWFIKVEVDGKYKQATRAFVIMEEIAETFKDTTGTLGKLSIDSFIILQVNDNVAGYRVQASSFGINERPTDD